MKKQLDPCRIFGKARCSRKPALLPQSIMKPASYQCDATGSSQRGMYRIALIIGISSKSSIRKNAPLHGQPTNCQCCMQPARPNGPSRTIATPKIKIKKPLRCTKPTTSQYVSPTSLNFLSSLFPLVEAGGNISPAPPLLCLLPPTPPTP